MNHAGLTSTTLWLMLLLGAYHGLNPGMGWLFAVALGLQEQRSSAVARSLVPIALGHALAVGCVVLTAVFLGLTVPLGVLRYSVAAILLGLGTYCLVLHHHPRWVRMQVGFRDLTLWSFLMASALSFAPLRLRPGGSQLLGFVSTFLCQRDGLYATYALGRVVTAFVP